MKTIIALLMCFELIIAPTAPSLGLMMNVAHAESCPQGFQYDSTLNRCLTSTDVANVMNATANCAPADKDCYKSNAESVLKQKESSGEAPKAVKNMGFVSTVGNAVAVAVPMTIASAGLWRKNAKPALCPSISYYALLAGGASLFVGDNLANFLHKKRLKEIDGDWKKIIAPNASSEQDPDQKKANATEAQSQAFEMLARSEESLAKAAKMKSVFFAAAAAAFATAAGIAIYENLNKTSTCVQNTPESSTPAGPAPPQSC
jgi:hypothetical protein